MEDLVRFVRVARLPDPHVLLAVLLISALTQPPLSLGQEGEVDSPLENQPATPSQVQPAAQSEKSGSQRGVIEEITVTAQKKEQSLREVPISISVIDSQVLAEQSITDFLDLSSFAGNFKVNNEGGILPPPDIRIRGFGTAEANRAFEQSVGLSIDGDTFGQQGYFQSALFDVERIEVLKGPQGTLFGKNTTAGLLNVVLAEPTDELSGVVDVQYGEFDLRRFEAAVSGPLLPFLNIRIAGLLDERDGLLENTMARTDPRALGRLGARDRKGVRVKLEFPDLLGARLGLTAEQINFDTIGSQNEIADVEVPAAQAFYEKYDPNVDTRGKNFVTSVDVPEESLHRTRRFAANGSYDWAGWGLDAVLGYAMLDITEAVDGDMGPAPLGDFDVNDGSNQTTIELRGASPTFQGLFGLVPALGSSELTAGFFVQRKRVTTNTVFEANIPVLVEWQNAGQRGIFPDPATAEANRNAPTNDTESIFSQLGWSYAGFAQMRWYFLRRWTLEYGMRVTHETKDASIARLQDDPASFAIWNRLGHETFDLDRSISDTAFTPKVALLYDVTDDVNLFASYASGFKSGGFNENAVNTRPENRIEYDRETMRSWEIGSKTRLLDGAAFLNMQLFWMEAEDLQVFTIRRSPIPATFGIQGPVNAGKARARGIEADGAWLATDWFTFRGTFGFNDSEFLDFAIGTCEADRIDTDGDGDPRCSLTGESLSFTPKWNATFTPAVRAPLPSLGGLLAFASGVDAVGHLTVHYEDVHFTSRSNDPRTRQSSFVKLDGRVGIEHPEQGWSLTVTGKNLTDEVTSLIDRTHIVGGSFRRINAPPRLWFGSFRWRF